MSAFHIQPVKQFSATGIGKSLKNPSASEVDMLSAKLWKSGYWLIESVNEIHGFTPFPVTKTKSRRRVLKGY
ncbi:hypothetical protein [Peribacillus simplex]|uniref:hypothetical protein n=1 Tax=Peribacillus simplex TaxID=1478 RepID=UPI003D2C4FE1